MSGHHQQEGGEMNGPMDAAEKAIADALRSAAADINGGSNGKSVPPQGDDIPLLSVGEGNANRLRVAGERTAQMVEEQAAERLAVAESMVEEAKALKDKAKKIADDIRTAAEIDAKRSIELTTWMYETGSMMDQVGQKFLQQE